MKNYAIGDIHGCYHALHALMIALNPGADDTLIFLGDYVDRGPDTPAVLDWLIDHSQTHNIVTLRGNHEVMMMERAGRIRTCFTVGPNVVVGRPLSHTVGREIGVARTGPIAPLAIAGGYPFLDGDR